jgi:hypothetical protein
VRCLKGIVILSELAHRDDKNRLLKADEEEYGPYTGNEGPTVE